MKLTVVGCASGMPSPNLAHSCYLIEQSGRSYMFDCGGGAPSALLRCSVDTSTISNIFISHTHPDHVTGIFLFLQMEYLKSRTDKLVLHVPSEFESPFEEMLRAFYLFPQKLRFDLRVRTIDDNSVYDDGPIQVRARENSHLRGHDEFLQSHSYPNRMQCFSFAVAANGRKLVYSADISKLDDLADIASDADLLLTEGMHLDLDRLPHFLIERNVKRCLLTHLPEEFDRESAMAQFAKHGYTSLDFAEEGLMLQID